MHSFCSISNMSVRADLTAMVVCVCQAQKWSLTSLSDRKIMPTCMIYKMMLPKFSQLQMFANPNCLSQSVPRRIRPQCSRHIVDGWETKVIYRPLIHLRTARHSVLHTSTCVGTWRWNCFVSDKRVLCHKKPLCIDRCSEGARAATSKKWILYTLRSTHVLYQATVTNLGDLSCAVQWYSI